MTLKRWILIRVRLIFVLFVMVSGLHATAKYNVCTVQINSSEEIETAKKYLSSRDFDFIELTDFQGQSENDEAWFEEACKSGVTCDVLLVSGHFAGTFFGSSRLKLSTSTMERHSCRNSCANIVKTPIETFLFGCNTLAGKPGTNPAEQTRTRERYYRVLVEEGIDSAEAARRAEEIYGETGFGYKTRMEWTFQGVPYLYGFYEIAPAGNTIQPMLENYFKSIGDYKVHLESLTRNRSSQEFSPTPNQGLKNALINTTFLQSQGTWEGSESYRIKNLTCPLYVDNIQPVDRVNHIAKLLRREDYLAFIPSLSGFLKDPGGILPGSDDIVYNQFRTDARLNSRLRGLVSKSGPSLTLSLDAFYLLLGLHVVDKKEGRKLARNLLAPVLKKPDRDAVDSVCAAVDQFTSVLADFDDKNLDPYGFKLEDFGEGVLETSLGAELAWCANVSDPAVFQVIAESFLREPTNKKAESVMTALVIRGGPEGHIAKIARMYQESSNSNLKELSEILLGKYGADGERVELFRNCLQSKNLDHVCFEYMSEGLSKKPLANSELNKLLRKKYQPSLADRELKIIISSIILTSEIGDSKFYEFLNQIPVERNRWLAESLSKFSSPVYADPELVDFVISRMVHNEYLGITWSHALENIHISTARQVTGLKDILSKLNSHEKGKALDRLRVNKNLSNEARKDLDL